MLQEQSPKLPLSDYKAFGHSGPFDFCPINMELLIVKTTLEIPDSIFRQAKSVAAQRGIALRAFVTEAVEEKLAAATQKGEKPWVAGWRSQTSSHRDGAHQWNHEERV